MATIRRKAYAYITHKDRLLLFRQPHSPSAGIQVPGGTLEENESPEQGVLREVAEETGLEELEVVRFLGEVPLYRVESGEEVVYHRFFYQLRCMSEPLENWEHWETLASDGTGPHPFRFFWARLTEVPPLSGAQDDGLSLLMEGMQAVLKPNALSPDLPAPPE